MDDAARSGIRVGRPLAGVRVLAIEQFVAGPYGSMLLADAGAEVIKIEQPGQGEEYRREGPPLPDLPAPLNGSYFWRLNRGKRSVTLDLSQPAGRELFLGLVRQSDVVWENLKAGSLERLGLDYPTLRAANPAIIYLTITGFGHEDVLPSPFSDRPAFDIIAQSLAGILDLIGEVDGPPLWPQVSTGDIFPGLMAAFALTLALRARDRDGRGRRVDLSLYDALLSLNERNMFTYGLTGEIPRRGKLTSTAPYGTFRAKDGYVVIATLGQRVWLRFCAAIGRPDLPDDPRLARGILRARHLDDVLRPLIEQWLADKTPAEAVAHFLAHGVPAAEVQNAADVFRCPHVAARHMLIPLQSERVGPLRVVGNPIKVAGEEEGPATAPPDLGADNARVLGELLHLDAAQIAGLHDRGVI